MLERKQRHVNLAYDKKSIHDATSRLALHNTSKKSIKAGERPDWSSVQAEPVAEQQQYDSRNNQPEQSGCMNACR